jgi:hypothetical protein
LLRLARWLVIWLGAGLLVLVVIGFAARYHDGPLGPFPGGAMTGEIVDARISDWSAVLPPNPDLRQHVEVQVGPDDPRAVTTSYVVRDGRLYVFALLGARKTWPALALADDRVVVRFADKLYPLRAVRVTDPAELAPLALQLEELEPGATADANSLPTWYFRMEPRAP